ncbi:hypothetical protein AB4Z38_06975 [Arthrobacter sp. 2RAF6]|uniref:hypothetical protein n=1 Tax=Arthrobacter sp. 2RAF6 TaxID=3233002 RepID=UPI003F8F750B
MSDTSREEAAAKAMRHPKPNQIQYGEDLEEWVDRVMPDALAAADAYDAAQGIHRFVIDDYSVELAARALAEIEGFGWMSHAGEIHRKHARAVLAAAVKEEQA